MFCENCGREIPDNSKFCTYCGAPSTRRENNKKTDKKIFILGGCFMAVVTIFCIVFFVGEHIKRQRQEADIASAKEVAASIEKVLTNETVSTDMQQYLGNVISLEEDMKYLPQSFQNQFQKSMGEIPGLQYTKYGAKGFSFIIDQDNKANVYIASDERLDEWQLYPDVSSQYYNGEKQVSATSGSNNVINNSEYRYVKLISKESPILGYWQGDNSGMYVGYDTSADEEGFIIYLYTSDKWVQVLHNYEGFSMAGDMGQLNYSNEYCNVDVTIEDESHIRIHFQGDSYDGDEYISEYTFTKGELDDSLMEQLGGKWTGGLSDFGVGPDFEITYDNGYHCEGTWGEKCIDEKTWNEQGYYDMPHICLYDGQGGMIFLSPRGEFDGVMAFEYYEIKSVPGDNEQMILDMGLVGGGGGEEYLLCRDGSAEAKRQEALVAYQDHLDKYFEHFSCKLIYVDDDDIPELLVFPEGGCAMCTYKNGEVIVIVYSGMTNFLYKEKSGYYYYGLEIEWERCEKLEGDTPETVAHVLYEQNEDGDLDYEWYIGDKKVSEKKYKKYIDKIFDEYEDGSENMYPSLYEAYQALEKPQSDAEADNSDSEITKTDQSSLMVVEQGDTIRVSVQTKVEGAAQRDWEDEGEEEFVVDTSSSEFWQSESIMSDEDAQVYVDQVVGRKENETFELMFPGGDGHYYIRYTILEIIKN